MPRAASLRRFAAKLVLFSLLGIALAEITLRLFFADFASAINPRDIWHFHPTLGWTQTPGGVSTTRFDGDEVVIRFNSLGFHDIEHEIEKPAGTKRIVLLGDSFSEAVQVNLEQTFLKVLESKLDASGTPWETINLGIGDFGTAQAWVALQEYGFRCDPDIVLVQVFPLNDVCNNSIELRGLCQSGNDRFRPYFVESGDDIELTFGQPWRVHLRRALVTFGVLDQAYQRLSPPPDPKNDTWRMQTLADLGYPRLDPLFSAYLAEADQMKAISDGWRITEKILTKIVTECRSRGIAVAAVVIPWYQRVGADWKHFLGWLRTHERWTDRDKVGPLIEDYPEQRLGALFGRLEVPCVMMKPVFDEHAEELKPDRHGHLNPAGHRLTGEAIHEALLRAGLVR